MSNIDSIIERINNLMAIAENEASSDNEAQMAFERAQKNSLTNIVSKTGNATALVRTSQSSNVA